MRAWQANLDLQFCLDQYSVVTYITDYVSKDDSGMTEVLKTALKESVGTNDFDKLNYLKRQYFKSRQVGVCEAAYRLIPGLHMTYSSSKKIFVATGYPENRTVYYKKIGGDNDKDLEQENHLGENDQGSGNEEEDEPEGTQTNAEVTDEIDEENESMEKMAKSNVVTFRHKPGTYEVMVSLHEKYEKRPAELENICFCQFAMAYDSVKALPKKVTGRSQIKRFDNGEDLPPIIELSNGTFMKLRTKPYVIKLHASHRKQGYEELYAELQLYYPWRNEVIDLSRKSEENIQKLFQQHQEIIDSNRKKAFPYSKEIDHMKELLSSLENERPQDLLDNLDSAAIQENEDDKEEIPEIDNSELPEELPKPGAKPDGCRFKPINVPEEEQMMDCVMKMSTGQRLAFNIIIGFCQDLVMYRNCKWNKKPKQPLEAPRLIVHGKFFYTLDFLKNFISLLFFHVPFLISIGLLLIFHVFGQ